MPLRAIFENPTIEGLAALIRSRDYIPPASPLVPLHPQGAAPPLFCIHPAGGTAFCYMPLAAALGPEQPVYGVQASGLEAGERLAGSFAEMVQNYVAAIRAQQPTGPYHLLGWSFGGLVAHAMACHLQAQGESVALLAMLDTGVPNPADSVPSEQQMLTGLAEALALAGPDGAVSLQIHDVAALAAIARRSGAFPSDFSPEQAERLLAVYALTVRLAFAHVPPRFDGEVAMFVAAHSTDAEAAAESWRPFIAGAIETVIVPCRHEHMTMPEASAIVAAAIKPRIGDQATAVDTALVPAK